MSSDKGLQVRIGPLCVDVPQSLGYFGGIGIAVAAGVIEPPLGAFIAAVPLIKLVSGREWPRPIRFASDVLDGASKPVGGDGESMIRMEDPEGAKQAMRQPGRTARQIHAAG